MYNKLHIQTLYKQKIYETKKVWFKDVFQQQYCAKIHFHNSAAKYVI